MNKFFIERKACPACKSINKELLLKLRYDQPPVMTHLHSWYSYRKIDPEYLEGSNYTLNECKHCGLIYQEEILNESSIFKLYNEWIDYEKVFERIKRTYNISRFYRQGKALASIISFMRILPGSFKVMDFGMGFGTWCHLAKGLGCDVYGAELSPERINYAEGIKVISLSEIPDFQFDFINTEQVFEHLAEPLETLVYLKQSLKTEGIIKISVPEGWQVGKKLRVWDWERLTVCNSPEQEELIKSIWDWEFPQGSGSKNSLNEVAPLQHINCFNREVLVKMAEKAGLTPVIIPDTCNMSKIKEMKEGIKALLRPYYSLLFRRETTKKIGTEIFFKHAERLSGGKVKGVRPGTAA